MKTAKMWSLFVALSLGMTGLSGAAYDQELKRDPGNPLAAAKLPEQVHASAEFVLRNQTTVWLSLYVDGRRTVSVPPGDQGTVLVVPGHHNFSAVTLDGTGRSVARSGRVSSNGATWTVTENR
jgi:hypothetical protein